jgi:hypothetical protein
MQDIAKKAKKAGYPRVENGGELMTERARDRSRQGAQAKENELFHGRPEGRTTIGGGRMGKYGMTV